MPVKARQSDRSGTSLESRVESLCARGCREVRQVIATLERGDDIPETQDLTAHERCLILADLKSIMAVYGDACRVD